MGRLRYGALFCRTINTVMDKCQFAVSGRKPNTRVNETFLPRKKNAYENEIFIRFDDISYVPSYEYAYTVAGSIATIYPDT